ncbi:hypothetical protein FA743_11470 [Paracoccus gahaiensis]|uniref:Cytochrome c domain-containing protein n=1 Tax=Paracoccus gahaiensis TaxID=1706839 RepID=A0A4U0RAA2_9RHOB|nr:di-heme oxidoredictase family protein [Paracoccus gahaiensis]TJZ91400.1 hypothetical protein FA743_11470 [Paracoccus gahaiensis]
MANADARTRHPSGRAGRVPARRDGGSSAPGHVPVRTGPGCGAGGQGRRARPSRGWSVWLPTGAGPAIGQGARIFRQTDCAACNRPEWPIAMPYGARRIRPHGDFLLHDLGPSRADPAPEPGPELAPGEWPTAPLWGLGHAYAVGGERGSWLHDGPARRLTEATLWHGGTAQPARDAFAALGPADRAALIFYLDGL